MLEFVSGWVRRIFLETLPNNMCWCRFGLTIFGFLNQRLCYFLQFSSCGPWRVFSYSNSPYHRTLGWFKHTSSSRQFCNIFCWLEILNYCPDGGNGNFHCSSSFLKATSLITNLWSSIIFCCTSEIYSLVLLIVMDDSGNFGFVFPPIYISVKQEAMSG